MSNRVTCRSQIWMLEPHHPWTTIPFAHQPWSPIILVQGRDAGKLLNWLMTAHVDGPAGVITYARLARMRPRTSTPSPSQHTHPS
jgi:hypothetical protein